MLCLTDKNLFMPAMQKAYRPQVLITNQLGVKSLMNTA